MLLCEYDVLEHYKQVHPPESAGELRPGSAGDALPLRASVCTDIRSAGGTGKWRKEKKEKKKKEKEKNKETSVLSAFCVIIVSA
jgi:hypothetical protein